MATLSSKLVISLLDRASAPARRIAQSLGTMKEAGKGVSAVGASIQRTTQKIQRNAATASVGLSAPAALTGGLMLRNAYGFDKAMRMAAATSEATEKQLSALQERVETLGKIYPKTRREIAQGAQEYITAGNSIEATIAALPDLVRGAIASNQSVGKTGADVTDIVAAYYGKISDPETYAKRVREVLDLLSVGATSSNHVWGEQTLAMQYATPVARALGIPLADLVAMIGTLADNGFKGEKGGSALRTMLIRLRKPTKAAAAALKELGIDTKKAFSFNDAKALDPKMLLGQIEARFGKQSGAVTAAISSAVSGKTRVDDVIGFRENLMAKLAAAMNIRPGDAGMEVLASAVEAHVNASIDNMNLGYLFSKMKGSNLAQQTAIFGVRRAPQGVSLTGGWDIFTDKIEKINKLAPGATQRRMETFMKGFSGSVDRLVSSLDNLSAQIEKSGLLDMLTNMIDRSREFVNVASETAPGLLHFAGAALLIVGVLGPMGMLLSGAAAGIGVVGGAAKLAGLSLLAMSRVSLTGLAVAPLLAGWTALSGAIGRARVQHKLMTMEMAAGNLTRAGAMASVIAPWSRFKGVLGGVLSSLRFIGKFTLVGAAIAGAATFLYNNWKGLGSFFSGLGAGFIEALGPAQPVVEGIANALGNIIDLVSRVFGPLDESGEKWRAWGKTVGQVLAAPINGLANVIKWVGSLADGIGRLFGFEAPAWLKWIFGGTAKQPAKVPTASDLVQKAVAAPKTAEVGKSGARTIPESSKMRQVQSEADQTVAVMRSAKMQIESIANSIDLTSSGQKIMLSLARGMRNNIDAPVAAIGEAATRIRNHVPNSPAKEGPLRGIHRHGLMTEIARGMTPSPMVEAMRQATAATAAIGAPSASMTGLARRGPSNGAAGRAGGPVNVSVTVNAQTNASADDIARMTGDRVRQAVQDQIGDGGWT